MKEKNLWWKITIKLLGKFDLTPIPPAFRGVPQIYVTIKIDANSILTVSAENIGDANIEINIDSEIRISPEEMEKMIKDAETFLIEDKKLKKTNNAKNDLEHNAYSHKHQISDKNS